MNSSVDISSMLAAIRQNFIDELPDNLVMIENLVMNNNAENFHEIYRKIHSLKGSGGTVGLPVITAICHQFESFLVRAGERDSQQYDTAFADHALMYVDLLRETQLMMVNNCLEQSLVDKKLESIHYAIEGNKTSILTSGLSAFEMAIIREIFADKLVFCNVNSGLDALAALTREKYDLFITALETPELNGLATIAAIRQDHTFNHAIVTLLLTSSTLDDDVEVHPDYIVKKDTNLGENLSSIIQQIIERTK